MTENVHRECPFCKEMIKENAIKCKHCHSMLNEDSKKDWQINKSAKLNVKHNRFPIIIILSVFSIIAALVIIFSFWPQEEARGNSVGNINNAGIAALQGDWIYYTNYGNNKSLFKVQVNGTDRIQITNDYSGNINVIGEWVYYTRWENISTGNQIYQIRTDGTDRAKLNNDNASSINVVGDWIYYISVTDDRNIYKMRTDGSERTKLNNDKSYSINVVDRWIYYIRGDEGSENP